MAVRVISPDRKIITYDLQAGSVTVEFSDGGTQTGKVERLNFESFARDVLGNSTQVAVEKLTTSGELVYYTLANTADASFSACVAFYTLRFYDRERTVSTARSKVNDAGITLETRNGATVADPMGLFDEMRRLVSSSIAQTGLTTTPFLDVRSTQ